MQDTFRIIFESLPFILGGSVVTIGTVAGAMLLGLAIGLPLAVGQVYGPWPVRRIVGLYVWFFRGTPILVLLFLFYFGLFGLIGLNVSPFLSSCLVLGLASSAYQSQIFRGSIESLPQGQLKAARALGMSDFQGIKSIILPQALRISIPGWSNEYSIILKDSVLAYVIGTQEIMSRAHFTASREYAPFSMYFLAGVLYFIITWIGVRALRRLEKKVQIPGYTTL